MAPIPHAYTAQVSESNRQTAGVCEGLTLRDTCSSCACERQRCVHVPGGACGGGEEDEDLGQWCAKRNVVQSDARSAHAIVHSRMEHREKNSTAEHSTEQYTTAQHSTPHHTTPHHITPLHSTPQHTAAQHSTAQHAMPHHHNATPPVNAAFFREARRGHGTHGKRPS